MEPTTTNSAQAEKELLIKMVISNWDLQNSRFNGLIEKLSEEQLQAETAPGRNSGTYLLGHLAAVSDGLFKLLGLGDRLYPALDAVFLASPDKSGLEKPSLRDLKTYWHLVNAELTTKFNQMQPDEWFAPHTAIAAEDFAKEPHRNKLNILINRTNHLSYHLGQVVYLKA